jgi:hypothetical protein
MGPKAMTGDDTTQARHSCEGAHYCAFAHSGEWGQEAWPRGEHD